MIPARVIERIRAGHAAIVVGRAADVARLAARVPVRAFWTTDASGAVEEAVGPERTVIHLFDDPAPAAVRRALAANPKLRALVNATYRDGSLILVGFRAGDPDLHALLERVLVAVDPPVDGAHLLVATGVADAAALAAEHQLEVVAAEAAPFLEALAAACEQAGVSLARARPGDEDLEGWTARLAAESTDGEAAQAIAAMQERARAAGRAERVVEVLLARVELEHAPPARARLLAELARTYELDVGDLPRAFTALTAALHEHPADEALVADAERLAAETDGWGELVADLSEVVPRIADKAVAAGHWARLGRWYHDHLHHDDYAIASYRSALKLDAGRADARTGLEALYRRQQRWGELAESLAARADIEARPVPALVALAELYDTALASPNRAAEAYEKVLAIEPGHGDALTALERIYRRGEVWGKLAAVLERRAGEGSAAARTELAQLRAEKLGDVEGAIARWKVALAGDPGDLEALRSLATLYDKLGRGSEYLDTLEQLEAASPPSERPTLARRIAAEVEDRHGGAARAIRAYERVLEHEPTAAFALRSLERLYRAERDWPRLVALLERQVARAPAAEPWAVLGQILVDELDDPARAAAAYEHAVELAPDDTTALAALAKLYRRLQSWDRAVAVVERLATVLPAAARWHEAGELYLRLGDPEAEQRAETRALELDPGHLPSLLALVELARRADRPAALDLYARVLALDPENVEAGRRAVDHWLAVGRFDRAEPVLEMLVRKGEPRHGQLADAARALGKNDLAARHYRLALDAEPGALAPALALAELAPTEELLQDLLARHRPALTPAQVVGFWYELGVLARTRGDRIAAEESLREALALEPAHGPALRQLAEVAAEQGDWVAVVRAKRDALPAASPDEKGRLLEEIGDVTAQRLGDAAGALAVYAEALKLRPRAHALLHKSLDIHTEARQWRRAVEVLDKLAEIEADARLRAKYRNAAALICRDELGDAGEAVARMGRALDDDPALPGVFAALEELLVEKQDWKGLARALQSAIKRLGGSGRATAAEQLALWTRLGDVAREQLGDRDAAMAAYEVAAVLDPGDAGRHEQLAELYLAAGPSHVEKAAAELQLLLRRAPDRLELYRRLHEVYAASGQRDKSYCLAQALVFLGHATDAQRAEARAGRPAKLVLASRRLTEELWQKNLLHPREDRALSGIFGLLTGALAATTAQSHQALALNPKEQVAPDDARPAARLFRYAAGVLGISPTPELYLRARAEGGVMAANVAEKGVLTPAVIVNEPPASRATEADTAFEIARKLSYFRPERYVIYALQSAARLEAALAAALVTSHVMASTGAPDVDKLAAQLARTVPPAVLEHVAALARKHPAAAGNGAVGPAVAGWIVATDLTANRVGLVVAGDLETAARAVATDKHPTTTLGAKERLRELLGYWSSEEHFAVRRHLGLEIA